MADNIKPDPDADAKNVEDVIEDAVADSEVVPENEPTPEIVEEASEVDVVEENVEVEDVPDDVEVALTEVPVEPIVEKRSVFFPAVLGGIVAAGLGFVAGKSDLIDGFFPNSSADQAAAFEQAIGAQSTEIQALRDQIAGLAIPDLSGVEAEITALSANVSPMTDSISGFKMQLDALNTQIVDLEDRITAVEKRPISEGVSKSAIEAYENELARLQASMATQRAEVESLIETARSVGADAKQTHANAASVLQVAANRALLAELRTSLDTGSAFEAILTSLAENGIAVPDDLSASASGVTTLAALQDEFPTIARAALTASREANPDTGLGAFIKRQLGARSVAPRDGTDTDSVLSRAEAALTNGQIQAALDELATLPDTASTVLADWSARAKQRIAAVNAVDALGRELNTK